MKIALIGYGKMGKAIEQVALQRGHIVTLKIQRNNPGDFTPENITEADVVIEFTSPESAFENVSKCLNAGVPVVCGSTGWQDKLENAKAICQKQNTAFIWASNFSVGVNIFFELNKKLAILMKGRSDYEVRIEETHHTQKKDAPSGTAITLAEQVIELTSSKKQWHKGETTNKNDLPVISFREEGVPGTHVIQYSSAIDDIEIKHTAHNREGFALGAVLAAEFVAGRKGIFTMNDVLNI